MGEKGIVPEADKQIANAVPDTALANYLSYYSTLAAPGYAVLVTGPWGVGKTHQVKKVIPETKRYFVSLYGLDSVNAIHDAVLAACIPSLKAGEYVATFGEVGKAMGDHYALAGFANSVWNTYLRQRLKSDRTIVFDDLERSPLQTKELLGAINYYVEHRGFRVVVICHDERIAAEIAELKEKTFGHTVQAVPQTEAAFDAFLADITIQTESTFVSGKRSLVEEIWAQSGQSSLRILKHVLNDIARLSATFDPRHLANQDAIDHVLRFFCALDIEVRAGNLNRDLLIKRMEQAVSERMKREAPKEEKPVSAIVSRYASSDLTGTILSDEIVEATLIEGRFDPERITAWLDQTQYFIKASDAAPWQIVMQLDALDDDILNEGIALMQSQFDERSVTNIGEFLHIAALRLMMAEQNVSGRSMDEETNLSLKYIDDLLSEGRLPAESLEYEPFDRLFQAYGGYSYWTSDTTKPHFDEICKHVKNAQQQALKDTYPDHAKEILRLLKEEPSSIYQTISPSNYETNPLAHIPILAEISPKSFVDAWLDGPRSSWQLTMLALDNRYEHGQLERHLRDERPWLIEVEREMDVRIDAAVGLDAFRLKRIKPNIFNEMQTAVEPK
ncbi:P-loop NTPase fold protein [Parasphingorhabdus sp. JC815]|uniref:P-loop NTPase fold protein n=1 Tax=Parasphingorhabdus sp. JC815 TaxID=3232140 RepID=UPI0034583DC0